jgi:hypothetical protein
LAGSRPEVPSGGPAPVTAVTGRPAISAVTQQVNGISREGLKLSLKMYGTGHWKALLFRATLAESSLELGLLVDAETTLLEAF